MSRDTSLLPELETFCPGELAGRPVVMVLPGGGYRHRADHEGAPVARWLNSLGINAVVVHYEVARDGSAQQLHPAPINHARETLRWLRSGESGLGVDTSRIGVLGFSAGGHLAATLSTGADAAPENDRPDLSILCYPVISLVSDCHQGSVEALLGPEPAWPLRRTLSAELAVDARTPPAFIWHTANDGAVPVANPLSYTTALARRGIPFALHVFPEGRHGLGLAGGQPGADQWPQLCARWLAAQGWCPAPR